LNGRFGALALVALAISLAINWVASCLVLWFAYGYQISYSPRHDVLTLMWKMGLIITILTCVVWLLADRKKTKRRGWKGHGWNVTWKTCAILTLYVAVVLIRRNLWDASQGVNVYAMFLPIVGRVNGQFLSEYLWLIYLIQVIPIVGLISGGLYLLRHWLEVFWSSL
jgi:amino acid transporter